MVPPTAVAQLRKQLSSSAVLLTPSDAQYNAVRKVENRRFDKRPAVIVQCATNSDVAATVRFAREQALELSIRSGGCSPAGFSSNDGGVLLDLSKLNALTVDHAKKTATAGAGLVLSSAYATMAPTGLMLVAGECRPVGISGITLGGGFSLLSRSLGLACDNVLGATMVTADGAVVIASANEHPDLFWALRGAGNGNFGVVTSLDLQLHPMPANVYCGIIVWPLARAVDVLTEALAFFANEAPNELDVVWSLGAAPNGERVLVAIGVYNGAAAEGEKVTKRLTSLGKPAAVKMSPQPYAGLLTADFPSPAHRIHEYFKSGFVTGALPKTAVELLVDRLSSAPEHGSELQNMILFELAGGAVNRVTPTETAFVHRRESLLLSVLANWEAKRGDDDPAEKQWADRLYKDLAPWYSGQVYQNYPDVQLADFAKAYYGENLPRLRRIKKQYDPENVFHYEQSIRA